MKPSTFLKTLWSEKPEGCILIWTLADKRSYWISDPADADRWEGKEDVYHGLAKAGDGKYSDVERVKASEAFAIPGLWCDFDYGENHKGKNYPVDEFALVDLMVKFDEPTIVVGSGHGRHAYWLFDDPLKLLTSESRLAAAELVEAWQRHIADVAEPYAVDSTYDLARVLRLPNTVNGKDSENVKPVRVIKADGPRQSYEWWRKRIADLRASRGASGISTPETFGTADSAQPAPTIEELRLDENVGIGAWWTEMLELMPDMRATFEHRKRLPSGDESMSAYDLALASYAVKANRSDQEIADIIMLHRKVRGDADDVKKATRDDYVARTIVMARQNNIGAPVTMEQIDDLPVTDVFERLGLKGVKRVVQLLDQEGNPLDFRLEMDVGNIHMTAADILSEAKWRAVIFKATLIVTKNVPRGTWSNVARRIAEIVVRLRPGDPGHPESVSELDETREWMRDYFNAKGLVAIDDGTITVDGEQTEENVGVVIEQRRPFAMTNERHLFIDDFVKWVDASRGNRLTQRMMGERLRDAGMESDRTYLGGSRVRTWFISDQDWARVAF